MFFKFTFLGVLLAIITLTWQDNASNELGTIVEKTISGNCTSGFVEIARVGADVTQWIDNITNPGDCYRVAAFNAEGVSAYSNTAQVPAAPPTPPPCVPKGKSNKCR